MRLRVAVVLSVAIAAALAGPAGAGFVPAWSYLSPALRAGLAAKSGGSLYLPARTPLFYRYRSGASVSNGRLTVPFRNRVRIRAGLWRWTAQTFRWQAIPVGANVACATWKRPDQTLQVDGNKVFWSGTAAGGTAWRCVTDRRGRRVVLAASAGRNLGAAGLATVVASGLDVSRRTTTVNVSLAVRPSAIHRRRECARLGRRRRLHVGRHRHDPLSCVPARLTSSPVCRLRSHRSAPRVVFR